jgi:hypothetical protein
MTKLLHYYTRLLDIRRGRLLMFTIVQARAISSSSTFCTYLDSRLMPHVDETHISYATYSGAVVPFYLRSLFSNSSVTEG